MYYTLISLQKWRFTLITEEQRKARLQGIGASDSPIIMGASTYKTPYELFLEKTGIISMSEQVETERQFWGNKLESVILQHFAELNGVDVTTPATVHHKDYDFLFANLDGYIPIQNAVVEVKNVGSFMRKEWDDSFQDGVPAQYLIQIAKQVMVAEADKGYFAILIGGNEYLQFEYQRDEELENIILEADLKFWDFVQTKTEPALVNLHDYKLKFRTSVPGKKIYLVPEISKPLSEYVNLKSEISRLTEKQDSAKMQIMKHMEDADLIEDGSGKAVVTWKTGKRGRVFLIK